MNKYTEFNEEDLERIKPGALLIHSKYQHILFVLEGSGHENYAGESFKKNTIIHLHGPSGKTEITTFYSSCGPSWFEIYD